MPYVTINQGVFFDETGAKNVTSRRSTERFQLAHSILTIATAIESLRRDRRIELSWADDDEALTDFALTLTDSWKDFVKRREEEGRMWCWDWYIEEKIIEKYGGKELRIDNAS